MILFCLRTCCLCTTVFITKESKFSAYSDVQTRFLRHYCTGTFHLELHKITVRILGYNYRGAMTKIHSASIDFDFLSVNLIHILSIGKRHAYRAAAGSKAKHTDSRFTVCSICANGRILFIIRPHIKISNCKDRQPFYGRKRGEKP